jgi:hypothetical protein
MILKILTSQAKAHSQKKIPFAGGLMTMFYVRMKKFPVLSRAIHAMQKRIGQVQK